ncbi:MAG TPA: hypothetical protein VFA68_08920 [Terriglobales bacterium]|nr:hypothetical protein [Terriglobales bacterium]
MIRRLPLLLCIALLSVPLFHVSAEDGLPKVELSASNLQPRPIEDLTSKSVPRDYAHAWQTMAQALDSNRVDLINGYFTGFAKEDLTSRIEEQKKANIHVRYDDRGHKLEALFYSPAGDAMLLRDRAQLEMQIMDGDKVIDREQLNIQYMVMMTPGADRWLVRALRATPEEHR